jgi:hypothetical protein
MHIKLSLSKLQFVVLQQLLRHKNLNLVLFRDGPVHKAASRLQLLRCAHIC